MDMLTPNSPLPFLFAGFFSHHKWRVFIGLCIGACVPKNYSVHDNMKEALLRLNLLDHTRRSTGTITSFTHPSLLNDG